MKRTALFLSLVFAAFLAKADYTASFYPQKSDRSKKLFTSEHKIESKDGVDTVTSTYKDLDGNPLYIEKVQAAGTKVQKVEVEQKQTGDSGVIEVKDGRVHFTKTSEGKTKTSEEKYPDNFVVPGTFQAYVRAHWSELMDGKTLDFRFGVWDRRETVGFSAFKIAEEDVQGQKAVVIKMKPSSFLIAAIVNPLIFKFAADGSKLLEFTGRVPVKKKDGNSWKDQDADVVYAY